MEFATLLADLGREMKIDLTDAVASCSCTLAFGTSNPQLPLEVSLEASDQDGVSQGLLHLHAVIGEAPVLDAETLFGRLLQMHVLGFATMQGMFGYDPLLRRILFFRSLSLPALTEEDVLEAIERFVDQAERWRDHLPAFAASANRDAVSSGFLPMA